LCDVAPVTAHGCLMCELVRSGAKVGTKSMHSKGRRRGRRGECLGGPLLTLKPPSSVSFNPRFPAPAVRSGFPLPFLSYVFVLYFFVATGLPGPETPRRGPVLVGGQQPGPAQVIRRCGRINDTLLPITIYKLTYPYRLRTVPTYSSAAYAHRLCVSHPAPTTAARTEACGGLTSWLQRRRRPRFGGFRWLSARQRLPMRALPR
jgi:hypothetical protein